MLFPSPLYRNAGFLLLALQTMSAKGFPADGEPRAFLPTFTILEEDGGREIGQCAGKDLENIKGSWEEACKISESALTSINKLVTDFIATEGKGPIASRFSSDDEKKAYGEYHRLLGTWISLFGTNPVRPDGNEEPGLTRMRNFHSDLDRLYCNNQKKEKEQFVSVFCTDNHYKFLKLKDQDPGDPDGRLIEETQNQCTDIGGIWYSPKVPEDIRYRLDPPPREPEHGPMCHEGDTLAVTVPNQGLFTWCTKGLNSHTVITFDDLNIKASEKRYHKKDMDKDRTVQKLEKKQITHLEDLKGDGGHNMPVTWLHEMVHIIMRVDDVFAVIPARDGQNARILTKKDLVWNAETQQREEMDVNERAYGYERATNLARVDPPKSMENPDNIALYALAMHFDEFDWSRGWAMPLKEPKNIRKL